MAVPHKLIRAHGCHMAILYRNLQKPTEPLPSLQTNKACLFDLSSEGQFRNQAVTGLPDTSYRMRVSEGKRVDTGAPVPNKLLFLLTVRLRLELSRVIPAFPVIRICF